MMRESAGTRIKYIYTPRQLSDLEYKVEQAVPSSNGAERMIYNRHGIRFIFVQSGLLGEFDLQVLLVTLVTALGLMAVATTITDLLMTNVLNRRSTYKGYKVLETPTLDADETTIADHSSYSALPKDRANEDDALLMDGKLKSSSTA